MDSATKLTDWKQHLGRRLLIKSTTPGDSGEIAHEVIVTEVAEASGFVKLHPRGWFAPDVWNLVEVLPGTSVLDDLQAAAQSNAEAAATHAETAKKTQADLAGLQTALDDLATVHRAQFETLKAHREQLRQAAADLTSERQAHELTKGLHRETKLQLADEKRAHIETRRQLSDLTTPNSPPNDSAS